MKVLVVLGTKHIVIRFSPYSGKDCRLSMMRCQDISDEDVEAYVMGKLQVDEIRPHLETCQTCKKRVADWRSYIAAMKTVLREQEKT
jgi:hypothetical protein